MLRSIFEKWPDSEVEARESHTVLSCLFSAVEDNDNAIAAWNVSSRRASCQSCFESLSDVTIFLCKQCLAVWLCTDCHSSLLSDDLPPEMCNKKHNFLEIPEYDSSEWEETGDAMIKVRDSILPRKDWLDGLRVQWNVTEEQLARKKAEEEAEARASDIIGRRVGKWWKESRKQDGAVQATNNN